MLLTILTIVGDIALVAGAARIGRVWWDLNAARNQAHNFLAAIENKYAEAISLPSSLPKTFPAQTQYVPLRQLPPELQAMVAGHFRATLESDTIGE